MVQLAGEALFEAGRSPPRSPQRLADLREETNQLIRERNEPGSHSATPRTSPVADRSEATAPPHGASSPAQLTALREELAEAQHRHEELERALGLSVSPRSRGQAVRDNSEGKYHLPTDGAKVVPAELRWGSSRSPERSTPRGGYDSPRRGGGPSRGAQAARHELMRSVSEPPPQEVEGQSVSSPPSPLRDIVIPGEARSVPRSTVTSPMEPFPRTEVPRQPVSTPEAPSETPEEKNARDESGKALREVPRVTEINRAKARQERHQRLEMVRLLAQSPVVLEGQCGHPRSSTPSPAVVLPPALQTPSPLRSPLVSAASTGRACAVQVRWLDEIASPLLFGASESPSKSPLLRKLNAMKKQQSQSEKPATLYRKATLVPQTHDTAGHKIGRSRPRVSK